MKKMLFVFAILGGIFLAEILCPKPVQACDYCLITQGLSPLETTHGLGLRLNGRYTVLNSVFTGSNEVENHDGEKETHLTTELTTFYNVSDRFTLIGILSLPRRKISLNIAEDHGDEHDDEDDHHDDELVHSHNANGSAFSVGDLNVLGRFTLFSKHNFQQTTSLAIQGGIKIPTGPTKQRDDAGSFLDAHIQPGTGSWNFLAGLSFNFVKNKFGLSSNVLYSINTTGKAGNDDYRFGNWLNADITTKYPVIASNGKILFLSIGINGEFRGKEEINGQVLENTGGEVLYASPGLRLVFSHSLIFEASFLYPFHHNLNGPEQLGEDLKTFFGVNYLLN